MTGLHETAFAKLNLVLHVRRREADGYHAIETVFVFCADGDGLSLRDAPGLEIVGPFAGAIRANDDNLVLRAAHGFARRFGQETVPGFVLDKRLPVAAGIGGGSADAAAALRLLCRRFGIDPAHGEVMALAASLGADVPACLLSRPTRGTGRGDRLVPLDEPFVAPVLLVNPMLPLATGPVFARWDGVDRGPLREGAMLAVACAGRNDLEPPALELLPAIGDVLALLRCQPGVTLARMSGSGATCFALFETEAARDAADRAVLHAQPGWWRLATMVR